MGKLFERICSINSLRMAWKEIEGKGSQGGIDGMCVSDFAKAAERHLGALSKSLLEGKYSPEPAERIHTPKFNTAGEFRPLSMPSIKDKVAQLAVKTVIEPFFERRFLPCSYAYRPEKGAKKAVGKVIHYISHDKKSWAVFGDLDNFFDTLNHDRLIQKVQQVIYEPEILSLIRMWMKIGAMDHRGRYHDMDWGIAQGGIISPLLSNVYAHELDVHATGLDMAYIRYADNFIVLADSREEAVSHLEVIRKFIEETLGLRLNPEKEPIRSLDQGVVFLGIFFQGKERFLALEKRLKIQRKLDWITNKGRPHALEKIFGELIKTIEGVRRYYGFLNPINEYKMLDQHLIRRLRVLLITRRDRKKLPSKAELYALLANCCFFAATEEKDQKALCKQLVTEVFGSTPRKDQKQPAEPAMPAAQAPAAPIIIKDATSPSSASEPIKPVTPDFISQAGTKIHGPSINSMESESAQLKRSEATTASPGNSSPVTQPISPDKAALSADRKVAAKKQRYVRKRVLESELVVETPGTFIGHRARRIVMYKNRAKVGDHPLMKTRSILIRAQGVTISSDLVEACSRSDVPIVFCSFKGEAYASVHAPLQSKPDLGLLQIEALRSGAALEWAKALVIGKIRNQLNLLKFYLRHREDEDPEYAGKMDEMEIKSLELQTRIKSLGIETPYEKIRNHLFGLEGQAGVLYWDVVRLLIPKDVSFPGRVTRGATDLVNASLNLGYSILYPRIERALLMAGLNLYTSLLHAPQVGKPTFSFDLIEPFRAPVVDRAIFSLLTKGRDLTINTNKRLSDQTVRMVIEAVIGRLGTLVPYKGEKITLEQVIFKQARLLATSLRKENKFKAFISRY